MRFNFPSNKKSNLNIHLTDDKTKLDNTISNTETFIWGGIYRHEFGRTHKISNVKSDVFNFTLTPQYTEDCNEGVMAGLGLIFNVWDIGLENEIVDELIVYPSPSTQVIIDNGNYSTMGSYTAKIVNTAGQQVFQSLINQQQFVIDAKTMGGAGVYTLYITDANNKVVGVKKIVLQNPLTHSDN